MFWNIKTRYKDYPGSPESTFRVYANDLREAVSKVLNIHRQVVIVTYQVDGGVERHYLEEKMPRIGMDTDSSSWLKH
jgi:hypothetical protein